MKEFLDKGWPNVSDILKIQRCMPVDGGGKAENITDCIPELLMHLSQATSLWRSSGHGEASACARFHQHMLRARRLYYVCFVRVDGSIHWPISLHVAFDELPRIWDVYGPWGPAIVSEEAGEASHKLARRQWKKSVQFTQNPRRIAKGGGRIVNGWTDYLREHALFWSFWGCCHLNIHRNLKTRAYLEGKAEEERLKRC